MRIEKYKKVQSLPPWFLLGLAIAASNFKLTGIYILLGLCAIFYAVYYHRIKVPVSVLPLALFSCTYFLFHMPNVGMVSAAKILICPLIWVVGYNTMEARDTKTIFEIAAILAFGMAFHGLLNYLYNVLRGVTFRTGRTYDIWSGTISTATGQAINFTLFLAVLPWLLLVQKKRWLKIVSMMMFAGATLYGIQIGSRTYLVLCLFAAGISVLSGMLQKGQKRKAVGLIAGLCVVTGALIVAYSNDCFGIRTVIENSYLFYRVEWDRESFFGLLQNDRFDFKRIYIENMFRYPWGGYKMSSISGSYAHDLWLDIFNEAGILALIGIFLYTVLAFIRLNKTRKDKRVSAGERTAIVSYSVILCAQFFVEPIWQGAPLLLCSFVLIDGMLAKFLSIRMEMRK